MKNKILLYFLLIGISISPIHADSDQPFTPVPEADELRNETVKKQEGNSTRTILVEFPESKHESSNITRRFQSPAENESSVFKPQKIKKKILISNLKNATEKVLTNEKYDKYVRTPGNVTDEQMKVKHLVNMTVMVDSDGVANATEGRRGKLEESETNAGGPTLNDTFDPETSKEESSEGRSFQSPDARRKSAGNFKYFNRKNRVTTSTTEAYSNKFTTSSSYMYFTLGEVQKPVNNNYLNINEDSEKNSKTHLLITSYTPTVGTTAVLPSGNPPSISNGNSVKNLVRLESGHNGSTDQTDWIPLVPVKNPGYESYLSTLSQNTGSMALTTVRPSTNPFVKAITPFTGRRKLTTEATPLPSGSTRITVTESVSPTTTASNSIPIPELEDSSLKGSLELRKVNRTINGQVQSANIQRLNKFRGSVKYRTSPTNTSVNHDTLKRNGTRVSNVTGDGSQKLEIPQTGSWDAATVPEFSSARISTTTAATVEKNKTSLETSTAKPYNESVGEIVKPKNIAKVQILKNTVSDKISSDNPMSMFKFSETEPPSNTSKPFETFTLSTKVTPLKNIAEEMVSIKMLTEIPTTTGMIQKSTEPAPVTQENENDITTTTAPKDEKEIELTASRELFRISTIHPKTNTSQGLDTTTIKDEVTTTEESVSILPVVTETENEALYTTEEASVETTFKIVTEQDSEMSTDEVPVPPRQPTPSNATADENKPSTERENDIEFPDPDGITNATERTEKDFVTPHVHHPNLHREITEENVPAYLKLTVEAASWEELCRLKDDLKNAIIRMLDGTNVTAESIVFLNLNEKNCRQKIEETKDDPPSNMPVYLPVNMFIMNENGDFDKNLSEAFLNVWGQYGLDFELPIRKVDFLSPLGGLYDLTNDSVGVSVIAAIVISCVAGLCVILLGILFVVMKRRQKRFNYGQRCTPVSLDAYSLDSVSIHNSVRRKGIRTSKRSYGNAAFDDPEVPSHSMNFAGLANFSSDKDQLHQEFNIIPQVYPKSDELPAGAETKNRYANVIPLPETRVHLSVKDGDVLSDYINANYVRGLKGSEKLYIACQAPMESTVEDFWRMIWEQQCKVVLMLTDLQENGVEKCFDYLPPNEVTDNLRLFGDYQVTMKKRDVKEKYVISHLKLKNMEANLWREVTHLWYLGWPEQGVPTEANSLIAFLIEARSQMKSQTGSAAQGPAVVHCSPGTGRTGTVIACDLCIREFEQTRMVDIPKCVFSLRKDRAGSVQTKDQYAFIYQVLNVYATKLTGGGLESI